MLFHRWLHRSADLFSDVFRQRDMPPQSYEHMAIFCNPEVVSAYVERLETTTLPFAIDAAHIINVVPPRKGEEYIVLDDACGTGAAVEWIVKEFEEEDLDIDITATDTSAVMINEVTKRRERLSWGDNVKFVIMDAQHLDFPNNTFTHAFLTFGIMLIPQYKRALRSLYRVLRRDGQIAITAWKSQGHWDYLTRAARQVLQDPTYPPPRFFDSKWLSGEYIARLLEYSGFRYAANIDGLMRNVKVHERTHSWQWSSKNAFVRFVGMNKAPSIQMYMAGWTVQQKKDVVTAIKEMLDHDFPEMDTFTVPMIANIVVGRK